jgi:hypothetical protein
MGGIGVQVHLTAIAWTAITVVKPAERGQNQDIFQDIF